MLTLWVHVCTIIVTLTVTSWFILCMANFMLKFPEAFERSSFLYHFVHVGRESFFLFAITFDEDSENF